MELKWRRTEMEKELEWKISKLTEYIGETVTLHGSI